MESNIKTFLIVIFLALATFIFAQFEEEAHHILKDPAVSSELYKSSTVFSVTKPQLSPEIEFTKGQQAVKIPFSYPVQKFVFSSRISLIRKTITSDLQVIIKNITVSHSYLYAT